MDSFFFLFLQVRFQVLVEGGFDVRKFLLLMRWSCTHFESHFTIYELNICCKSIQSSDEEKSEDEIAPSLERKNR
jgi:hypothetical protein